MYVYLVSVLIEQFALNHFVSFICHLLVAKCIVTMVCGSIYICHNEY